MKHNVQIQTGFFLRRLFKSAHSGAERRRADHSLVRLPAGILIGTLFFFQTGSHTLNATADSITNDLAPIESSIKKVILPNNIRLLMMKRSYAPIVALYIKIRAGGADETPESAGIAHMLEHMLFKGTPSIGTRNYEKEKKYLRITNLWASRLDEWRRRLEEAEKSGDREAEEKAKKNVAKWKERLGSINTAARDFMIMDEDSSLYSRHGQRGYNAYTSRDLTNYQIELPSNRLEVWARMESDRIKNSVLRDFYTERDVVSEERRMRVDNVAQNSLMEKYLQEAYGSHPYGQPLIGPMKSIEYLNYEQAYEFYKTYYAPNNMVISVVGDLDFDETEAIVRRYFGDMKEQEIPRKDPPPPPENRRIDVTLEKKGSPFQLMGWFKPPVPHKDDLYLEILSQILAGRSDSRLFKRLVVDERIASQISIYSGYPGERMTNLFLVIAVPAPGRSYDEVQKAVLEEIEKVKRDGVTEDELDRVRKNLQADFVYSLRSNASLADRLSYYETIQGDYTIMFEQQKELEKVTPEMIRDSARRNLSADTVMTARLLPPRELPDSERSDRK